MKNVDILIRLATLKASERIHKRFTFAEFNTDDFEWGMPDGDKVAHCGTAGCLAGELPGLTKEWIFDPYGRLVTQERYHAQIETNTRQLYDVAELIAEYFDIPSEHAEKLFIPRSYFEEVPGWKFLGHDATMRQVQANLKAYLKYKGVWKQEKKS